MGSEVWQIDIANLTNIITRVGADGLKRFALAGVDIHTIGCLYILGELTPACPGFRRSIQQERARQRKESWFIHSVVEYGAGTNFVIDELLKTRAGENVLALLTSTISFLGVTASSELLSLLFEDVNAPSTDTPSLGQLQTVYTVALPLARRLDFKDRVAEMGLWLGHRFDDRGTNNLLPWITPPAAETMVDLISSLRELQMQSSSTRRLVYSGKEGAAWLLVYATRILGLATCVVSADGTPLPATSTYESAVVLLYPSEAPSAVTESATDPLRLVLASETDTSRLDLDQYLLHCGDGGINVFKFLYPFDLPDMNEVGNLIFSGALEFTRLLSRLGYEDDIHPINERSQPYFLMGVGNVNTSVRGILHALGLPEQLEEVCDWRHRFFARIPRPYEPGILHDHFFTNLQPIDGQQYPCGHAMPSGPHELDDECPRCRLYNTIERLIVISSVLVFSDWLEHFRKISVSILTTPFPIVHSSAIKADGLLESLPLGLGASLEYGKNDWQNRKFITRLLADICGQFGSPHLEQDGVTIFGLNYNGVVILEADAVFCNLRPKRRYIVRDGQFSLGQDRRTILQTEKPPVSHIDASHLKSNSALEFTNELNNPSIHVWGSLKNDRIVLKYEFKCDLFSSVVDVRQLIGNLRRVFLCPPCTCNHEASHVVERYALVKERSIRGSRAILSEWHADQPEEGKLYLKFCKDSNSNLWVMKDTLKAYDLDRIKIDFAHALRMPYSGLLGFVFPVVDNSLGQWIAASSSCDEHVPIILTRGHKCFQCIAEACRDFGSACFIIPTSDTRNNSLPIRSSS